ncbi:MAG TPA: hydroxypyruvate isomerase, partial [Cobetia sp.]|nr:hydroxypyruvate isomerase [Cobetia sp.]
ADDAMRARCTETYIHNLRYAAAELEKVGKTLLIEPINPRDMPGFYLSGQAQAREILAQVGAANLKVQFDLYHCQIVEGDLIRNLE